MRFAIVLVAAFAACGCSQNAVQTSPQETEAEAGTATAPELTPVPLNTATAPPDSTASRGASGNAAPASSAGEPAMFAYDPRAPNWRVASIKLSDNRWRLELRMRRWHTGGDGEAEALFRDQARDLAQKQGYRHYVVLSWVQGIESTAPIAQRWARGEIELQEAMPPMPLDKP